MTRSPHTTGHEQPLRAAHHMMQAHYIRHLPVLDGGRLVGALSQRDLCLMESLEGVDSDEVSPGEAMSSDDFTARQRTTLDRAVSEMARWRPVRSSVVVIDRNAVVGVFTITDALGVPVKLLGPSGHV